MPDETEQMVHVQLTKETRDTLSILKKLWDKPRMSDVVTELLEKHYEEIITLVRKQNESLNNLKKSD